MCLDCQHWKRHEAFEARRLLFVPCALRPDKWVKDNRAPGGMVEQAYRVQSTYQCPRFARIEQP